MFSYPDFTYDFLSVSVCPSHKGFHAETGRPMMTDKSKSSLHFAL